MSRLDTRHGRSDPPEGLVRELLTECVQAGGVDGAGFSLSPGGGPIEPVLGTDEVAEALEHLQFTLGAGPCIDATISGSPVLLPDLDEAGAALTARWPMFVSEARSHGVRAVFAFPLRIGALALGWPTCTDGRRDRSPASGWLTSSD